MIFLQNRFLDWLGKVALWGPFFLIPILILVIKVNLKSPEQQLLGRWKEMSWNYEKLDKSPHFEVDLIDEIDEELQHEIYSHLIIHKAEVWDFSDTQSLYLLDEKGEHEQLEWDLKGRGNIIEIKHPDHETEQYIIQEMTPEKLVLQFNSDLQTRGIIHMTFERIL